MHLYIEKKKIAIYLYSAIVILSSINITPISELRHIATLVGVIVAPIILYKYRYKPSKPAICLFAIFLIDAVFTFYSGNMEMSVIYMFARIILFIVWNDFMCKKFPDIFMESLFWFLTIIYLIQIITQMIDQSMWGVARSGSFANFTVTDNYLGYYYVPFIMILVVRSIYKFGRINFFTWIMGILCLLSVLKTEAISCTIGVGFYLFSLIYISITGKKKSLSLNKYFIIYLVFFVLIVEFNVLNLFDKLLGIFFSHDSTLAGRTNYMWPAAIDLILKRPILAYGTQAGGKAMLIRIAVDYAYHAAHNYFLTLLIETGLFGLMFFIIMLYLVGKRLNKIYADNCFIVGYVSSGIVSLLIMFLTEGTLFDTLQYSVFFIAFYCDTYVYHKSKKG